MAVQENGPYDSFGTHENGHGDSFLKHNQQMRSFRTSHSTWTAIKLAYLNMTVPYSVGRNLTEAGGSAAPVDEDYWLTLVPMQEVAARRFVFN